MDENGNDDSQTLTGALHALVASYEVAVRALGRHLGLGPNDLASLQHLMAHPDLGPADLAAHLGITSASATVLVDRLEESGLVERQPHPNDRRRQVVRLTPLAPETVLGAMEPLMDAESAMHADYNDEDRAVIVDFLRRTTEIYGEFAKSIR